MSTKKAILRKCHFTWASLSSSKGQCWSAPRITSMSHGGTGGPVLRNVSCWALLRNQEIRERSVPLSAEQPVWTTLIAVTIPRWVIADQLGKQELQDGLKCSLVVVQLLDRTSGSKKSPAVGVGRPCGWCTDSCKFHITGSGNPKERCLSGARLSPGRAGKAYCLFETGGPFGREALMGPIQ